MELRGARVLITGASKGIGAALAEGFAGAGAQVALAARSAEQLADLAERLDGTAHPVDLADPAQVDGFIARVEADGGPIDVLVNNAGMEGAGQFESVDEATITQVINVNLIAPERLCRQALPGMVARGRGHIVNVSSLAGVSNVPGAAAYASTKAGLTHFTSCLRMELKGTPIGTTVVAPGPVATEMWDRVTAGGPFGAAAARLEKLKLIPICDPADLAAATVKAVGNGKRFVRLPKVMLAAHALEELPRTITSALLAGVKTR
jgi:short-subunit dehydrogenase